MELTKAQQDAVAHINGHLQIIACAGSGKTEVYLQAAAHVMKSGRGVLILVPEISLTPQTMARFKSRFADTPGAVAILHSAMSDGERFDEWHAIHRGKARIVNNRGEERCRYLQIPRQEYRGLHPPQLAAQGSVLL